jgi:predicted nuclease of predicted toxin-antitoxin system
VSGLFRAIDEAPFLGAGGCLNGFLFDENLPRRLRFTPSLPWIVSDSLGVSPTDSKIWSDARDRGLAIVTKDADFSDRIMLSAPPPWIVHLRFGNLRRNQYHALLAKIWPKVEALLPAHKLICVYSDRIEAFRE